MSEKKVNSILFVEDEREIQDALSYELNDYCENLYLASNGEEGLSLYKEHSPDIVITDIKMPIMDGLDMAENIKSINPKAHIVFTTAFSDTSFLIDAIELQADGYIIKPIDLTKLEAKLESIITQIHLQKELDIKERMLIQQSKLASMGEMLGNIAHQWRQPLSVISVSTSGLQVKLENNMEVNNLDLEQCAKDVLNHVNYLSDTIDDFRDFLKPSNEFYAYNIKEFLTRCITLVEASFGNNNIDIIVDIDEKVQSFGDPKQLSQAIINILNNAKDALKDATKIEKKLVFMMSLKVNEKALTITIKDNAGRIDDKIIDKIFEPYFTTKHKSVGTGLGLYITHNIITKSLNGTITVTNDEFEFEKEKYKGAKFVIELPLVP